MSLDHALFYKSVNGDRVYDDTSFEHWLKKFFTSGVFLNDLQVTANEDMTVTVGAGYVNADGKVKIFESATSLIIETAGATYPRIDSIVLERNDTERDIIAKVIKGGYSSEPVPHTPVRQDGVYQLVIAQILVNAGAVKISQADITDTRSNTELCGIVAGAVEQIDFSQVQAQFDSYFAQYKTQIAADYTEYNADMEEYLDQMAADFATWFEGIRNQLDEDVAGHLQNQIDDINARLEYAGGSMVEVTVNDNEGEYNVEGLEVNLVIDGKTYTETVTSENVAKFTGVLEVGTAVITCVDAVQEFNAETSIDIPYYGAYETSMNGGVSYENWIEAGGLNSSSYESLEALLEDEKAIRTLMTKKAAVDILAKMRGSDLATIINHPYVAKWVNYREYAYSTLSAVPEIKVIMDASGMYGMYITVDGDGTWEPKGLVPVMTSNTAPYGTVSASTSHSDYPAYQAFIESGAWSSTSGKATDQWLQYKFVNPTCVKKVILTSFGSTVSRVKNYKIQGSNDGSVFEDLYTGLLEKTDLSKPVTVSLNENNKCYLYYRLYVIDSYDTLVGVKRLQFYGRQLEALVPPMTSNTAPIGEASASSIINSNYGAWKAFDGSISTGGFEPSSTDTFGNAYVQYEFENPTIVKAVGGLCKDDTSKTFIYKLQASNNGTEFETLVDSIEMKTPTPTSFSYYAVNNDKAYKYYRFVYVSNSSSDIGQGSGAKFQLYGAPDYESRTYIYDHGVEVMELETNANNSTNSIATKENDYLYIKINAVTKVIAEIYTKNTLDLTNYSVLCCNKDLILLAANTGHLACVNSVPTSYADNANFENYTIIPNSGDEVTVLDVSSINKPVYFSLSCVNNTGTAYKEYTFNEWWLE